MDDSKDLLRRRIFLAGHEFPLLDLESWEPIIPADTHFDWLHGSDLYRPRFLWRHTPATLFPAAEAVARTCWTLWKDKPERIWDLVAEWADQGGALAAASLQILVTGSELGHLTPDAALETLGPWLAEGSAKSRAAARLLPPVLAAMPGRWDADQLRDWMGHSQPNLLRDIIVSLFPLQPEPCIQLFFAWAQDEDRRFDGLLVDCFQNLPAPELESPAEYRKVETRLRHLRVVAGNKRNPRLNRKIGQFLQKLHGAAGKKANDPPRRGPGSRGGPGPDRRGSR
jgi:hypothetical protein